MHADPVLLEFHDYFLALTSACAALLGLLFVALSIHLRTLSVIENTELRAVAQATFIQYGDTLAMSAIGLLPITIQAYGAASLAINLGLMVVGSLGVLRPGLRGTGVGYSRNAFTVRMAIGYGGAIPSFAGMVLLILGQEWALYVVAAALLFYVLSSTYQAWELVFKAADTAAAR